MTVVRSSHSKIGTKFLKGQHARLSHKIDSSIRTTKLLLFRIPDIQDNGPAFMSLDH